MPEVIDNTPRTAEIGGAKLDYFPNPLAVRTFQFNPLAPDNALVKAALQSIAMCLTRDDALVRECLALRQRVDELERRHAPPVELDLAALQTKTAAPEGSRGPDDPDAI